ncbi:MAG: hypothetical protein GY751_03170 [Bacteroidetes bacterium]|nr:hypothetical protein [Bacteroidota bacterium]
MNVRQFSYVLLLIFCSTSIFIQCKSTQASISSVESSGSLDLAEIANLFVESVRARHLEGLHSLMPTVHLARAISPDETEGKSDKEIRDNMISPLKDRFDGNMDNIWKAIESEGKKAADVTLSGYEEYESDDPPTVPRVVNFTFTVDGKTATIPVTYMKLDGMTYVFEILKSTNIFK